MSTEERTENVERELAAARHIDLVDAEGQKRVMVRTSKDGPNLALFVNNGKDFAILLVREDGPVKILPDDQVKLWAALDVPTDKMHLELYDEARDVLPSLSMGDLEPIRELRNAEGKKQVVICVRAANLEFLLHDLNGRKRASLAMGKDGGWLRLFDEKEELIWSAP